MTQYAETFRQLRAEYPTALIVLQPGGGMYPYWVEGDDACWAWNLGLTRQLRWRRGAPYAQVLKRHLTPLDPRLLIPSGAVVIQTERWLPAPAGGAAPVRFRRVCTRSDSPLAGAPEKVRHPDVAPMIMRGQVLLASNTAPASTHDRRSVFLARAHQRGLLDAADVLTLFQAEIVAGIRDGWGELSGVGSRNRRSPMILYHRTSSAVARSILDDGFLDGRGAYLTASEHVGVWVSNVPLDANQGARGNCLLSVSLDVTTKELREWEWREQGKPYREFLIPAAVLNSRGTVRLLSEDPERPHRSR